MTNVDPEKVSQLKFRFSFAVGGLKRVPTEIRRLGKKAEEFFVALAQLSSAGNKQAERSRRLFATHALRYRSESVKAVLKRIELDDRILPVELYASARWKMDLAGILALEFLLWMHYVKKHPRSEIIGYAFAALRPFDENTADEWWELGRKLFVDIYSRADSVPQLCNAIPPVARKGSSIKVRHAIQRVIGRRLRSFARPPIGSRY